MLNQTVLVGRLTQDLKPELDENDRKTFIATLAVPRSYKNINGEYDTDFVPILLTDNIGSNVFEYCKKGDLLGIKGRIESFIDKERNIIRLIAEKVTFLSSKQEA